MNAPAARGCSPALSPGGAEASSGGEKTVDGDVVDVPFAGLAAVVQAQDATAFERAGFLVSPRFGLAFVPGQPDWVTALAAHCIETWRALPN